MGSRAVKRRGRPPIVPPSSKPLLAAGAQLPTDPIEASLFLLHGQLERATSSSEAANLGRSIASLSAEQRKREDALIKRQQRATLPENVELTKSMVEEWPQAQRRELRDWILTLEPLEGSR